jgi:copper chaperone CopZ
MKTLRLRFTGEACAACMSQVETELKEAPGVADAAISVMTGMIKISLSEPEREAEVRELCRKLIEKYEPTAQLV